MTFCQNVQQVLLLASQQDVDTICTATSACVMYYDCRLNLRVSLEDNVLMREGAVKKNVSVSHPKR